MEQGEVSAFKCDEVYMELLLGRVDVRLHTTWQVNST